MADYEDEQSWPDDWELEKSKSQVKRELLELKELGRSLIALPLRDLTKLDLPENLFEAVSKAQSMSKGALKRQVGYIGGLIAECDYQLIQQQLNQLKLPHQGEVKAFHQLENWRDRLLAGDDAVYAELIGLHTDFDVQHVRQLVRNAAQEKKRDKPPKSARVLFQYLQSLTVH